MTTSHMASDVRIYERECRSLAEVSDYSVCIAGPGLLPAGSPVQQVRVEDAPASKWRRLFFAVRRARKALRNVDADIYHFHDPELVPLAIHLARQGETVVWDAHEDYVTRLTQAGGAFPRKLANSALAYTTRLVLGRLDRNASAVIAATPTIARGYRNPITTVVGNEARLSDFASAQPTYSNRRVLFTGAPGGGHLFMEVVEALRLRPEYTLVLGRRSAPHDVLEEVRSILGERFEYLGFLDRSGLAREMSRSLLGFCTYAPTTAYSDPNGSPTKFFEFLAAGLPVVCSPIPSLRRLVEQSRGGVLAEDFSSEAIGRAIDNASRSADAWHELSATGRRWAAENDPWEASERRLIATYQELAPR